MNLSNASLGFTSGGLNRPESVIALSDGRLYVSDKVRGVIRALPAQSETEPVAKPSQDFLPNGIGLLDDGTFLIASVGQSGGLWRLVEPGKVVPYFGSRTALPASSLCFAFPDRKKRIWLALNTQQNPRSLAYSREVSDGMIAVVDEAGDLQIVATNLGFPNEVRVDPTERWLYVTETFAQRLSRFEITAQGTLSKRQTVCQFAGAIWPDGFEFDVNGGVWLTSVVSNRLIQVHQDGTYQIHLEDCALDRQIQAAENFRLNQFGAADMALGEDGKLKNISSLAFGGEDLMTIYLGSLAGVDLPVWHSPVRGCEPRHWNVAATVLD
jgi:sugar lactone lactonase YvrE